MRTGPEEEAAGVAEAAPRPEERDLDTAEAALDPNRGDEQQDELGEEGTGSAALESGARGEDDDDDDDAMHEAAEEQEEGGDEDEAEGEDEDDEDEDEDEAAGASRLIQGLAGMMDAVGGAGGVELLSSSPPGGGGATPAAQAEFRRARNRMLLANMLELRGGPVGVTESMVEFLLQEGVCETFLGFITQVPEDKGASPSDPAAAPSAGAISPRAQKGDTLDEAAQVALARSFNATMLLSGDDPSDALLAFLGKKAGAITEQLFEVFHPHARGSFHHACRVLDHLLGYHTEAVLHTVGRTKGAAKRFLGPMVKCLAHAPVPETFMRIVFVPTPPPGAGGGGGFGRAPPVAKWRLFESLAEWRLLSVLAKEVHGPDSPPAQSSAAADALVELVDRLATDDNGELLLQPLAHCPEDVLDALAARAFDPAAPAAQRCDCLRVLVALAARSGEPNVPAPGALQSQASMFVLATIPLVTNQFCSVRPLFQARLASHLPKLCDALLASAAVADHHHHHQQEAAAPPFSYLRLLLVTLLAEAVSAEDSARRLAKVPLPLWRQLCQWFFAHPSANLYHGLFYRLVYRVLRAGDAATQQLLLGKCRLVTQLVDAYTKGEPTAGNRGHVLTLCNALRLQAGTEPPSTGWLRNFLKSHDSWRKFAAPLREATERAYLQEGLGLQVPSPFHAHPGADGRQGQGGAIDLGAGLMYFSATADAMGGGGAGSFLMGPDDAMAAAAAADRAAASIDYGSALARSLGFEGEAEYSEDDEDTGGGGGGGVGGGLGTRHGGGAGGGIGSGSSKKKKKKKKGKGKKQRKADADDALMAAAGGGHDDEDEDDEEEEEGEGDEKEDEQGKGTSPPRNGKS